MSAWKPRADTSAIIDAAREVLATAAAGGFRFTLRRVFYALVSAEVLPNTERAYKNLSATLDRARWEGLLSLDCLDDLGRVAAAPASWENAAEALTALAHQYRSDWPYVEVWAEKAAVAGILEPMVLQYGVTFLACRGFASLTAIAESAVRFQGRTGIVLYVGDHDPSGLDMDRDLQERLHRLGADVELQRLALTVEQIDHHQLPPQPTKQSDTRTRGYHHRGSWELDALPAEVLQGIVRDGIERLLPDDFDERRRADGAVRDQIIEVAGRVR